MGGGRSYEGSIERKEGILISYHSEVIGYRAYIGVGLNSNIYI